MFETVARQMLDTGAMLGLVEMLDCMKDAGREWVSERASERASELLRSLQSQPHKADCLPLNHSGNPVAIQGSTYLIRRGVPGALARSLARPRQGWAMRAETRVASWALSLDDLQGLLGAKNVSGRCHIHYTHSIAYIRLGAYTIPHAWSVGAHCQIVRLSESCSNLTI